MNEEIEEIIKEAKKKGLVCKGTIKPIWSEPGIMYILHCDICTIKAVKNNNNKWSLIKQ
jgi:hypothetical protein